MTKTVVYPTGVVFEVYPTEEDVARDTITIVVNYQPEIAMVLKLKKQDVEKLVNDLQKAVSD